MCLTREKEKRTAAPADYTALLAPRICSDLGEALKGRKKPRRSRAQDGLAAAGWKNEGERLNGREREMRG